MKLIFLAVAACPFLVTPALAMTDTECATLWQKADIDGTGTLSGSINKNYMARIRAANKSTGSETAINQSTFMNNCKADVFKTDAMDPGAPLKGANSFTENQAKDRVIAMGMTIQDAMTKDADGIWRGSAVKDGKTVSVAVDYRGNVVTQ